MKYILCLFFICRLFALDLTLEEKIGQMLITHFHGEEANEEARTLIQEVHIGGLVYYNWANGLANPEQVRRLSQSLQALAKQPLFLCIDQEGGRVAHLNKGYPSNRTLGLKNDPQLTEDTAYAMGLEMHAGGINVVFAPVVDVNSNPRNPVIGDRAYGATPQLVATMGQAAVRGFKRAGVIPTLKHFPGHGDVDVDSHYDLPVLAKSLDALMAVELYPYRQLLHQVDMVMTAHISLPQLDPLACATFSQPILVDLLRTQLGYQGLVISDSLRMSGILKNGITPEQAALKALEGGCDILLLGGRLLSGSHAEFTVADIQAIHRFLVDAVKQGKVAEERIDASVARILRIKKCRLK